MKRVCQPFFRPSAEQYRKAPPPAKDHEFQDLLELSWKTGFRPNELYTVEARYVDLEPCRWMFPVRESSDACL